MEQVMQYYYGGHAVFSPYFLSECSYLSVTLLTRNSKSINP